MSDGDVPPRWLPAMRRRAAWDEARHSVAALYH